jgi:hypothetical protein
VLLLLSRQSRLLLREHDRLLRLQLLMGQRLLLLLPLGLLLGPLLRLLPWLLLLRDPGHVRVRNQILLRSLRNAATQQHASETDATGQSRKGSAGRKRSSKKSTRGRPVAFAARSAAAAVGAWAAA